MMNQKWYDRNNFSDNIEYTEKVLNKFNIEKYHFAYDNGELALLIEKGLKKYKVIMDYKSNIDSEVYICNKIARPRGIILKKCVN